MGLTIVQRETQDRSDQPCRQGIEKLCEMGREEKLSSPGKGGNSKGEVDME